MSIFNAFGLSAAVGLLCAPQGFGASVVPRAATVGTETADVLVWQPPVEIAAIVHAKKDATGSIIHAETGVDSPSSANEAAAFGELRSELTALRRAVDAIPTIVLENRPPDYAPTLGGIVKSIQSMEKRLASIESRRVARSSAPASPALRP